MLYGPEHRELQRSVRRFIDAEINPHVDAWEDAQIFPAHEVFRKLGRLGFLGLTKPTEFGGQGLDYSFAIAFAEALGRIDCGGVPMAIGVQTDMATPALARHGSDEVRREFLSPSISGELVACLGVSETGCRLRRRLDQNDGAERRRRLHHQRRQDVDHQRHSGGLDVPARQYLHRGRPAQKQDADLPADEDQGRAGHDVAQKARNVGVGHRAGVFRRRPGAKAQPHRRRRSRLPLSDAAVPGGAAVGWCQQMRRARPRSRPHHRLYA